MEAFRVTILSVMNAALEVVFDSSDEDDEGGIQERQVPEIGEAVYNSPLAKKAKLNSSMEAKNTCFICDTVITGKKYSLASCMTNGTKVRLVEVLGRLVSDNYMVVISHGDFICRGCANLLNTLDRLEAEISSVKRIVVNFVERKYKLGDKFQLQLAPTPVVYSKTALASAANTNKTTTPATKAMRAPQLTAKSNVTTPVGNTATPVATKTTTSTLVTHKTTPPSAAVSKPQTSGTRTKSFTITLKDEQLKGTNILQSAEKKVLNKIAMPTTPKNVYMQCNQCQFTTNLKSTMLEHLRQHVAARTPKFGVTTNQPTNTTSTVKISTATTSSPSNVTQKASNTSSQGSTKSPTTPLILNKITKGDGNTVVASDVTNKPNTTVGNETKLVQTVTNSPSTPIKESPSTSGCTSPSKLSAVKTAETKIVTVSNPITLKKSAVPSTTLSKSSDPGPSMPLLSEDDDL